MSGGTDLYERLRPGRAPAISGKAPSVAILGAGFSGLALAIRLIQSGVDDFTIFEKADEVGGTWRDNTYPGAACDVPSHLYSLSFAPKRDWSRKWAEQPEILDYLRDLTDEWRLGDHLRLGTEITSAEWTGEAWLLTAADGTTHEADVLVAATGQLNRPHYPDIPGADTFDGVSFHSARWDHAVPLAGRNVAVIGIGASAIQFVPPVAAEAGHTTLFQRSVNYVGPKADREFKEWETWAFTHVPGVYRLYRWSIYARFESRFVLFRSGKRRLGKRFAALFAKGLREGVVPHGIEERLVVPPDPVGCRRILISGDWYPTLLRPDVTVTDAPIEAITPTGIRTGDGVEHPADVIVYGTGFEATGFVSPVVVSGVDGVKLADAWADGAEAYLGLTVAGFPNFFLLYGPNTNLGHNSILVMVERQVEYVIRCLGELTRRGARAMDVAPAAYAANVSDVQDRVRGTVWAESCHSWYKTATGKVTQNWPGFTVTYWRDTLRPRFRDYRFQGRR